MVDDDRRRFVRHPLKIPLAVRPRGGGEAFLTKVGDLSEGGVSFGAPAPLGLGTQVDVELHVHHCRFTLGGTVATCTSEAPCRVGLRFAAPGELFRLKLAEQVLRIEDLRESLAAERGAPVSTEEAATVWVERYADTFADLFPRK
jgi:hypothetical protein